MKKFLALTMAILFVFTGCEFDTTDIDNRIDGLENRIEKLETMCQEMNTNISAIQKVVDALQNNDYVTGITEITEGDKIIGYKILFSKGETIEIYHGQDGIDGQNGHSPVIGVAKDADGIYYWTLDGEWLTDKDGNKIKAESQDGKDGVTPQLKIENDLWYISYDNGETWEELGKATGEDGDSFFKSIEYDDDYLYITLADGTKLTLPISTNIFDQLESITYVPKIVEEYTIIDRSPVDSSSVAEFDFMISPKSIIPEMLGSWKKYASVQAYYTVEGPKSVDFIDMPIISFESDTTSGIITVKASGENLSEEFFSKKIHASCMLVMSDGDSRITSEFIHLVPMYLSAPAGVKDIVAKIKTMKSGDPLAELGTFEGIIAANNAGGNLFKSLSIVDGSGKPNTGVYLYGQMEFNDMKVGDKVLVDLTNAKLDIFNGWREIKWDEGKYNDAVEIISHDNKFVTPEITVEELLTDDYQSMYVTVKDVKSTTEDNTTWCQEKAKNSIRKFQNAAGKEFGVKTTSFAKDWCNEIINNKVTANISGVANIYHKEGNEPSFTLMPITKEDVAAFIGGEEPEKIIIEGTKGDGIYTSNVVMDDAAMGSGKVYFDCKVKIDDTEYPCVKLGSSKEPGSYKIAFNKGNNGTVILNAVAWNGKPTNLSVQITGGGTIQGTTSVELATQTNEGAAGGAKTYTIVPGEKDCYIIYIRDATDKTELLFTTEGMDDKRVIMFGINSYCIL